jgi:hypothetical protein
MSTEQLNIQTKGKGEQSEFYGMDQVLAVYADGYVVSRSGGAYTLYFFQSQLPDGYTGDGQTTTNRHKCVGRIVLANEDSLDRFLAVLTKHRVTTSKQ